ncbi:condensation domain-containing protein [Actinomadura sp. DC4]|uniref:condensation domain-containing protein n=1 Tax=Actinomadura sp. DC4 TaxID=3055069 RepID=UPI0025B05D95|nr:condensation domain-containing protein [Actinomadura sp. DC4]MDN3358595.1 condensation domain-containing protein [Actinomadura sp. DC4]
MRAGPWHTGIWLNEQLGGAGASYHLPMTVDLPRACDLDRLSAACRALFGRHPVLAGACVLRGDALRFVPAEAETATELLDETALPERISQEVRRPFDVEAGPLCRMTTLVTGERVRLLVVAHHLVFDGMSKDVLARDLRLLYAGENPPVLPPPRPPEPPYERARAYWATRPWRSGRVRLGPVTSDARATAPGAQVVLRLSPAESRRWDEHARSQGVTRFELLFAMLTLLLTRHGNEEVPVAVALSTRSPADADRVGMHVNELPMITAANRRASEHVRAVRAALRELYQVRSVPLGAVAGGVRPAGASAPVSVSYRRARPSGLDADLSMFNGWAHNLLHLHVVDGDVPVVALRFAPERVGETTVREFGRELTGLLTGTGAEEGTPSWR